MIETLEGSAECGTTTRVGGFMPYRKHNAMACQARFYGFGSAELHDSGSVREAVCRPVRESNTHISAEAGIGVFVEKIDKAVRCAGKRLCDVMSAPIAQP